MVATGAEFPCYEIVFAVWENHAVFAIEVVHDLHIEVAVYSIVDGILYSLEFVDRGLDEYELGTEVWFLEPVCTRHRYGTRGEEK